MNIFMVDEDPMKAARDLHDAHVRKMIVESAQMLSTAHHLVNNRPPEGIYKAAYRNHPCTKWTRSTRERYEWVWEHAWALALEFEYRFGKEHKTKVVLERLAVPPDLPILLENNHFQVAPLPSIQMQYGGTPVDAYRKYYRTQKLFPGGNPAKWTGRRRPVWV